MEEVAQRREQADNGMSATGHERQEGSSADQTSRHTSVRRRHPSDDGRLGRYEQSSRTICTSQYSEPRGGPMPEAVIVATARSPIGRANKGSLTTLRPDDMSAQIVRALLD